MMRIRWCWIYAVPTPCRNCNAWSGHSFSGAGNPRRSPCATSALKEISDLDDEDTLVLDIRSAYAVPELQRLERTFVFRRGQSAALTVRDKAAFSEPRSFETTLITWGNWKQLSAEEVLLTDEGGAVRVKIDTGGEPFKISAERLNEDVPTRTKPLRLVIALNSPVKAAAVTLTITPELNK